MEPTSGASPPPPPLAPPAPEPPGAPAPSLGAPGADPSLDDVGDTEDGVGTGAGAEAGAATGGATGTRCKDEDGLFPLFAGLSLVAVVGAKKKFDLVGVNVGKRDGTAGRVPQ